MDVAVARNGYPGGESCDLLSGPDLLANLLLKRGRSYALDAMEENESELRNWVPLTKGMHAIQVALQAVAHMTANGHPAVGRGQDVRLKSDGLVGRALIAGGTLVHLGIWSAAYH